MIVRRFEDLVVWQLAVRIKEEVLAIIARRPAANDVKFCDQIRESARSAPRNIAEGFGRYYPKEFGRFLRIALASLHETKNHLHDGHAHRYITDEEYERLVRTTLRAIKAGNRLAAYLRTARPPQPFQQTQEPPESREPSEPSESSEPSEPSEP
ncbi:MAG TPA: four helix bundle protein [Vicinamibacterales bacterium]|jgi:four helix bundle protein